MSDGDPPGTPVPAPITLYNYAASPYGARVYWTLVFKRLPFRMVYVNPFTRREIGFSKQRVVPVLRVGDAWRQDSTPICTWLEELCPSPPVLGADAGERERILAIDRWVSERFIALSFRHHVDSGGRIVEWLRNGQRMGAVNHETCRGFPRPVVWVWPLLLRNAAFVRKGARHHARHATLREANAAVREELLRQVAAGPFLGGLSEPSLADLAAYGQLVKLHAAGLEGYPDFAADPPVAAWIRRLESRLPVAPEPPLVPGRSLRLLPASA